MDRTRKIVFLSLAFIALITCAVLLWFYQLNQRITRIITEKQLIPVMQFMSAPVEFQRGQTLKANPIQQHFQRLRYRERSFGQSLNRGDYMVMSQEECMGLVPDVNSEAHECIAFINHSGRSSQVQVMVLNSSRYILDILKGDPAIHSEEPATLDAEPFAQFIGEQPIIKKFVELGDTPPLCLNAVLAIEDSEFLEHAGVSIKGIGRAVIRNLVGGRIAQGGSTITQQLVKNYFLTSERTFKRKFTEIAMSILLESRATKDEILQNYINEIYMGQNGSFQIRGWGAASEYYFSKPLEDLNTAECALIAALVNAPGLFDPFRHPERALKRRELVLQRMKDLEIIDEKTYQQAAQQTLPKSRKRILSEPAPFFVDAAKQKLIELGIDLAQGASVYTTLNQEAQEAATRAVRLGLEEIEKYHKKVKEQKEKGKTLEGILISADPETGFVKAAVGGRSFKNSQFNRVTSAHRQVGSVMKPIVFYTALESGGKEIEHYNPLTIVEDKRLSFRYEGQKWEPENYNRKYFDLVPFYFALKESLNSATARIALDVGLDKIVQNAMLSGVRSHLESLPSLALGAFELYPWEVLQMYSTFSQLGNYVPLTFITKIEDEEGEVIYEHAPSSKQILNPQTVSILVGMMKQTIENGTARAVRLRGFQHPAAGKTGTTSDNRDAWFAGFTPHHVAVSWVGYDDNTSHGLTGASGALPIWTNYMLFYANQLPPDDFPWPESVVRREVGVEDQRALNVPDEKTRPLTPIELIFKNE